MRHLALAALLALGASAARADDPPPAPDPGLAADAQSAKTARLPMYEGAEPSPAASAPAVERRVPRWGLAIESGVPEGATASLVFRPIPVARFWAGPSWAYVAWGVQGGVAIVPWHWVLSPVLAVEAGRYFRIDVASRVKDSSGSASGFKPLLEDLSYSYASVHLGFDLGSQRGFSFGLRAGLSYVSIAARGTGTTTPDNPATDARVSFTDPKIHGTVPNVKLGFTYFF